MKPIHIFQLIGGGLAIGLIGFQYVEGEKQNRAVLDKISTLEARLTINNQRRSEGAAATLRGIRISVFKNNQLPRDVEVLVQSQQILNRIRSIADTLHQVRQMLRKQAHEAEVGALAHPDAPVRTPPPGLLLAQHLNRYTAFIRSFIPYAAALTGPVPDLPEAQWLYTDRDALAVALASLTRLEAAARRQAADALSHQAQKVGSRCICFDKIGAMAVASSNTVAPGAVYEAQLFITMAASSYSPRMTANGRALDVAPDGTGPVAFRVPLLRPDQPDTVRAWWHGTVSAHTYVADTTWKLTVPYLIVRKHSP